MMKYGLVTERAFYRECTILPSDSIIPPPQHYFSPFRSL